MGKNIQKLIYLAVLAFWAVFMTVFPAFAGMDNPLMGDPQGRYLGVVIAVMAVALVVIVIIAVISSKNRKK